VPQDVQSVRNISTAGRVPGSRTGGRNDLSPATSLT